MLRIYSILLKQTVDLKKGNTIYILPILTFFSSGHSTEEDEERIQQLKFLNDTSQYIIKEREDRIKELENELRHIPQHSSSQPLPQTDSSCSCICHDHEYVQLLKDQIEEFQDLYSSVTSQSHPQLPPASVSTNPYSESNIALTTISILNQRVFELESQVMFQPPPPLPRYNPPPSSDHIYGIVATNAANLLRSLPLRSPLRRPLAHYLMDDLSHEEAQDFFGYGRTFVHQASQDDGSYIMEMRRRFDVTVSRADMSHRVEVSTALFDEILPILSGRNWRVQMVTDERVYQQYLQLCADRQETIVPLAFSSFYSHLIAPSNIHRSDRPHLCPHCIKLVLLTTQMKTILGPQTLEDHNVYMTLLSHEQRLVTQKRAYLAQKRELVDKNLIDSCVVVHDFAQIKADNSFVQCLLIFVYWKPQDQPTVKRLCYCYLPPTMRESNDIDFVKAAWNHFIDLAAIKGFKTFNIWSDGGPKHFKIAENIRFFYQLAINKSKKIFYNFFESYHGEGVCDGSAAKLNAAIRDTQQHQRIIINTVELYAQHMKKWWNIVTMLDDIPRGDQRIKRLKGIKSIYRLDLNQKTWIWGYKDSAMTQNRNYDRRWQIQRDFLIEDLELSDSE